MPTPDTPPPERSPRGAGGPLILALMAATAIGFLFHQPTIGFLIGLGIGLAILLMLWRGDRRPG